MLSLHIVQAEHGDSLVLGFGSPSEPRHILIDGGPATIHERHLRDELLKISESGGKLDLAIASHVDNDHVIGLLDLMAELREQRASHRAETIAIDALWHNAFSQTVGSGNDLQARLETLLTNAGTAGQMMTVMGMALAGIGEGRQLRLAAAALGIPVNPGFSRDLISVDESPETIVLGNLSLRVVGPTKKNLEDLRRKWLDWLGRYEDAIGTGDPSLAAMADRSIPNLSSIMVLAEAEGKRILLTGDGRGDHLLQGLGQARLLSPEGGLHVDVLKVPHHGSHRNVTRRFFKTVTADEYVISANGRDGNPDLATLIWIVEAAREQGRATEILVTNETRSTQQLLEEYNPYEYGYRLTAMKRGSRVMTLQVAP